jgi:putative ABC transport system permease protein
MGRTSRTSSDTPAVALFRRLLLLYPAEFRHEYGREMVFDFAELYRDAAGRRGLARAAAVAALWLSTIADLAWSAPREHMDTIIRDVRYGVRVMLRERAVTAVAVLALALGAGANTAIFSVVDGVLLRPLPFPEPERLVRVAAENPSQQITNGPTSFQDYSDWKAETGAFAGLSYFLPWNTVLAEGDEPERLPAVLMSHDTFTTLGLKPVAGRSFLPEEDRPGGERVVMITEGFWKRRYGGDPAVVGGALRFTGGTRTIVGVVPDVLGPIFGEAEIFIPWTPDPANGRSDRFIIALGRLRPGATATQANAELGAVSARLESAYLKDNEGWGATVVPLMDFVAGEVRPALLVLLGAVAFVLLIACVNVANLLLARAAARRREVALRTALGATRWRLVRQFLTESVLLYGLGGVAGLAVAAVIIRLLVAYGPRNIPRLEEVSLDARALAFTFGVSVAVGLLFGIVPALRASREDLAGTLREARASGESFARNRLRGTLVVVEVALSFVLLVGAGLLVESFVRVRGVDPGFNPDGVVVAQMRLPNHYDTPEKEAAVVDRLLASLAAMPGARAVAGAGNLPLGGGGFYSASAFIREGDPVAKESERQTMIVPVTADYFRAMEIQLLRGRGLSVDDNRLGSPPVIVVNETIAARYYPGQDPVGKRVWFVDEEETPREIVGVVRDIRNAGLDTPPDPITYMPLLQRPLNSLAFVVRAEGDPASLVPAIKAATREVDPLVAVFQARALSEIVAESVSGRRFQMALLTSFAFLALLLAAVGVYGVMSYSVARRTNEIGVRVALGATTGSVTRLVVGQGTRLALAGIALGLAGALALSRVLESTLYGVSPTDVRTLATAAALLAGVAVLACYIPARRAARVDPVAALRHE